MIRPKYECGIWHKNDKCRFCIHDKIEERIRIHNPATGYAVFVSQFWCSKGCRE